jgi:hypothetical protein
MTDILAEQLRVHKSEAAGREAALKLSQAPIPQVVHPSHYSRFVIEPVTFCAANNLSFNISNIIKYVCRAEFKNGREDLQKAIRYLEMEIESMARWERVAAGESPQDVWKDPL